MKAVAFVFRIVCSVYVGILGLFLFMLGLVSLITHEKNLKMTMLPMWHGEALKWWMLALGALAVVTALLTLMGKAKLPMTLVCLLAFGLLAYGFFLSPVHLFKGPAEVRGAGWLTFGALGCFLGSLLQYDRRRA